MTLNIYLSHIREMYPSQQQCTVYFDRWPARWVSRYGSEDEGSTFTAVHHTGVDDQHNMAVEQWTSGLSLCEKLILT